MLTLRIQVSSDTKVLNPSQMQRATDVATTAIAQALMERLKPYPPATAANRPGRWYMPPRGKPRPMGYYERNRGYWYPIIGGSKLYAIGGGAPKKSRGTLLARGTQKLYMAGYRLRPSSEQLGKSWTVRRTNNGAILSNNATYAAYVHSADEQADVMAEIGWKTDREAIAELDRSGDIDRIIDAALDAVMK